MTAVHTFHRAGRVRGDGSDRRRDDRKEAVCSAWIYSPTATNPNERDQVTGVNVSRRGIAFDARRVVPTDAFLKIELDLRGQRVISEIRIIHCEPVTPDHFNVGAEFC